MKLLALLLQAHRRLGRVFNISLLICTSLLAESNAHHQLHEALLLQQQGHFEMAIEIAKRAVDSNQLSQIELNRARIILGILYQQIGRSQDAKTELEQAIHGLKRDPEHAGDYAASLNAYGDLCTEAGQLDVAKAVWLKALHSYRQLGDNAGAMRSVVNLAQLALRRRRMHEAKRYLKQASDLTRAGHDMADDDLVLLSETQGSLALAENNSSEAIGDFARALDLCRRLRGGQHWLTGWEHMRRGTAYAQFGDVNAASADMQDGLDIMGHALGRENMMYVAAQIAYSEILDRRGLHVEAARLRTSSRQTLNYVVGIEYIRHTINIAALK